MEKYKRSYVFDSPNMFFVPRMSDTLAGLRIQEGFGKDMFGKVH